MVLIGEEMSTGGAIESLEDAAVGMEFNNELE